MGDNKEKSAVRQAASELYDEFKYSIYNGRFGPIQSIGVCEKSQYNDEEKIIVFARRLKEYKRLIDFDEYKGFPVEIKYVGNVRLC